MQYLSQLLADFERSATDMRDSMVTGLERAATDLRDTMLESNAASCQQTLNNFMNIQRFL